MAARGAIIGAAACGLVWAGAGAASGAAAGQELQAGQTMTRSEADRLEAVEADLDRMEAEEADETMRDEDRRRRQRERLEEEMLDDLKDDRSEQERLDAERLANCRAALPQTQKMMIDQIVQQYDLMVRQLRADGGRHVEEAVAGLLRGRDQAVEAMTSGVCS